MYPIKKKINLNHPITPYLRTNTTQSLTRGGVVEEEFGLPTMTMEETTVRGRPQGATIEYIPVHVFMRKSEALAVSMNKNQKYTINIPMTPKGIHMMMNIVSRL